jgi:hypothetical protein
VPNPKRTSVTLQPMGGGSGPLIDFDDDYESDEDVKGAPAPAAADPQGHRPLVGGFAAAAYEAARAHHEATKQKKAAAEARKAAQQGGTSSRSSGSSRKPHA